MRLIRKLDIFIAKQFSLLFAGTFFISLFVLMMQFLWRYVDALIGKGLSLEVLAEFFWYMALMLIPQALPLAILLSSLITFGNLGESSELTAIKAAGISLMQSFRSLIFISTIITLGSFYFQNNIGPEANLKMGQLLLSMKQKSPELEIPEGVFYDGIPDCNLYVQKKNVETGKLYGIMIYRMNGSFEDAAIVLADSGMLQSTADKKHLLLTLNSGEWFENMKSQEVAGNASVPYRRESFVNKQIVLEFDDGFNLSEGTSLANNARGKSLEQIRTDMDSLNVVYDSIGNDLRTELNRMYYAKASSNKQDTLKAKEIAKISKVSPDTLLARLSMNERKNVIAQAMSEIRMEKEYLLVSGSISADGDKEIRQHQIEIISKFTMALTCLIFFFIGAPLGAIIRKGGLGISVIVSVLVFIVYYILDNTGYRMSRSGMWAVWFGRGLAPAVLIPTAVYFTYKASKDYDFGVVKDYFIHLYIYVKSQVRKVRKVKFISFFRK